MNPVTLIDQAESEAKEAAEAATTRHELAAARAKAFGKDGPFSLALKLLPSLAPEDRPGLGQAVNAAKARLATVFEAAEDRLRVAELDDSLASGAIDVTLPGRTVPQGGYHPSTAVLDRIQTVFGEMGFQVFLSREVESDEFNFELLNIPKHHPARDMQDTFFIDDERVLRTHTSPGQIHAMRLYCPEPIRIILPGMCFRHEQITPRSEIQFHQVEGLAVGPGITMADLKGVLAAAVRRLFGAGRRVRFRSSYFPFTEPSGEMDVECFLCAGTGCRVCKHSGWLEILGCGMVHPVVLANGGYDPDKVSGFAFGMGPERVAMLQHGIDDIRHFWTNDLRFLAQV